MSTLFESFLAEVGKPVEAPTVPFTVADNVTHKLTMRKGRAKNFRSIGNEFLEIDYQKNPSTLVTSDDNGAGKSTVLVWLPIFVLFNDTYSKREKKAGLVNSMSRKDCVGELEFFTKGEEWKIRRGIKPDFIEVYKLTDGEWLQLENDAAKSDTNKLIQELVGVDQKMFENAIVLGKEKYVPFSEMMTSDRRLMVETIWDMGFFSIMNDDVKAEIKKINGQLNSVDHDRSMVDTELHGKYAQLEQAEAANEQLKQHSQDALDFAVTLEEELASTIQKEGEVLRKAEELAEELTTKAKIVRQEVTEAAEPEVTALIASYEKPLTDISNKNKDDLDKAQKELDDHVHTKSAIIQRQEELTEERNLINKDCEELARSHAEAVKTSHTGDTFRVRFTTEIEGHQTAIKRFHDMGVCPTCTQEVSEDTKTRIANEYQPKITELEGKLAVVQSRIDEVQAQANTFLEKMDENRRELAPVEKELNEIAFQLREHGSKAGELLRAVGLVIESGENAVRTLERERDQRVADLRGEISRRAALAASDMDTRRMEVVDRIIHLRDAFKDTEQRLASHRTYMSDLRRKLAIEPTSTVELRNRIAELEQKAGELTAKQIELDESRQDHEHLLFMLRDDQTKARIISMYLPFLNSKINEYLEALNMFIQVRMDDTFDIHMENPDRKGQSIFSLSTGQRARLNIAITMALRDVANLKASVQCNILIFDEILENMSERGVQECVMMLNHKFRGNNLFVISQREQEFQEYFEHNIRYGLRNGVTAVIDKN